MTIGAIVRCKVPELPADDGWKPPILGERSFVTEVVRRATATIGLRETTSYGDVDRFVVESDDSSLEVDIPVSGEIDHVAIAGVLGETALAVIREICKALNARYYDSESGFIPL